MEALWAFISTELKAEGPRVAAAVVAGVVEGGGVAASFQGAEPASAMPIKIAGAVVLTVAVGVARVSMGAL
jgi:hypothetical protein